ncbi:acyl-CoA dehydrogenase [Sediminicurvatus halobius]|uniref:Acyl-CoA dehydrogenase n=1 Tax=Sediminicurvatus halobius TaxID=2182432 RepID=A0A2U2N534_9GAMM|nr:acyl-CoA dehydrogenase [Spiribacter halobius]PWG64325.1 hypothetical protein DEM34_05435 [Spiribacter halobius]UEX79331.1 acyl-CoA dehydrogenase [Spiribacter halobius]
MDARDADTPQAAGLLEEMGFLVGEVLTEAGEAPPDLGALLDAGDEFARRRLVPLGRELEGREPRLEAGRVLLPEGVAAAWSDFAAEGWAGLAAPGAHGGGQPERLAMPLRELWHGAAPAFAMLPMLNAAAMEVLATEGSAEQQARWLPALAQGRCTAVLALEDVPGAPPVTAEQADGGLRLSGHKGDVAYPAHDLGTELLYLVRAAGPAGDAVYLVADGDGSAVHCTELAPTLGLRGAPRGEIALGGDAGVPAEAVGEGDGTAAVSVLQGALAYHAGVQAVGLSQRAYRRARREFLPALAETDPAAPERRRALAHLRVGVDAMRALCALLASERDRAGASHHARRAALLAPVVKAWCTAQARELAAQGLDLRGWPGLALQSGPARAFRDAAGGPVRDVSNARQARHLVEDCLLGDRGETMTELLADLSETVKAVEAGPVGALARPLDEAVSALRTATGALLERHPRYPLAIAAGASPYLDLVGRTLAGWLFTRGAVLAAQRLGEADEVERDRQRARLARARFYAEHWLPRATALAAAVGDGVGSVLGMRDEWL